MIYQLHHQFKDGTTEMCAQKEVDGQSEIQQFFDSTKIRHPLPKGAVWLMVHEDSPLFWKVNASKEVA